MPPRGPNSTRYIHPVTPGTSPLPVYSRTNDAPTASHPVNRLLGDTLVTVPSAEGRPGEGEPAFFPNATVRVFPRINHIALAHRSEVYDEITKWWN